MYELMVRRDVVAQHYLTVPNCGPENEWHSHHFDLEVRLKGPVLNENGYLVDITEVEAALDDVVDRYEDATLNDQPEFEGLNPSVEHFARIIATHIQNRLDLSSLEQLAVRIWEDDHAWAAYSIDP